MEDSQELLERQEGSDELSFVGESNEEEPESEALLETDEDVGEEEADGEEFDESDEDVGESEDEDESDGDFIEDDDDEAADSGDEEDPVAEEPDEPDQTKSNQQPQSAPVQNANIVIKDEYKPGTEAFFNAVYEQARSMFEQNVGEEYDEYNPKHAMRFSYYADVARSERVAEYQRGVAYIRQQEELANYRAYEEKKQAEVTAYLNSKLRTAEEQRSFKEAIEDKISRKHYRDLEAQVEKGDFSGVDKLIDKVKRLSGKIQRTAEQSNARKSLTEKKSGGVLPASSLFE